MMKALAIFVLGLGYATIQTAAAQNLLVNPGFESGLAGWTTAGIGWRIGTGSDAHQGQTGAVCDVLSTQEPKDEWRIVYQNIPADPGDVFHASAWLRTVSLKKSQSTFEIQFLNAAKGVILQFNTPLVEKSGGYQQWSYDTLPAPPKTAFISVRGVVHVPALPDESASEFHTWDDFELYRLSSGGADKAYLKALAADTWRSIDALVEPTHGLPYDSSAHGDNTSTTNIGFYMASVVAAKELGFIDPKTAIEKLTPVVEILKQLPKWHGFQATWTNVHTLKPRIDANEHVVSMLDAGNFAASLVVVAQAIPELAKDCNALLDGMEIGFFYDPAAKRLHGGFDINANAFVPNWWVSDYGTDSRLISFLAIGKDVPLDSWTKLSRMSSLSHGVSFYNPGWSGGGLFMQYISGMFIDEAKSPMGVSARNFAFDQIAHKCDIHAAVWGWAACDSQRFGYTNTYGMMPHDEIVTPYANALAIQDWTPAVVQNFRELERLGARDNAHMFGFYDSYDTSTHQPSKSFLTLDQSMILISLCNYLKDGRIRTLFRSSPTVRNAYRQITDP